MNNISIIIPFKYRADHYKNLLNCLKQITTFITKTTFEIIIVEQIVDSANVNFEDSIRFIQLYDEILKINFDDFKNVRRIKYKSKTDVFNKSYLVNRGVEAALFDKIMLLDSDILFDKPNLLDDYFDLLNIYDFVNVYDCWIDLKENETIETVDKNQESRPHLNICSGTFLINKKNFLELGGFDIGFKNWGGEETAFAFLCSKKIEKMVKIYESEIYHQTHLLNTKHNFNNDNEDLLKYILMMNQFQLGEYIKNNKRINKF